MPKAKRKAKTRPGGGRGKRSKASKPSLPVCGNPLEEEESLSDEDLELLKEQGLLEGKFGFLSGLGATHVNEQQKNKRCRVESSDGEEGGEEGEEGEGEEGEGEEAFEARPRRSRWEGQGEERGKALHHLLPLKTREGLVHQQAVVKSIQEESESGTEECQQEETSNEEGKLDGLLGRPVVASTAALFAQRQQKLVERRDAIAECASLLVENPEENIALLKKLRALCSEKDGDVAITVRKLAMVSLTAVFKDIAPSYRIRELSEAEMKLKVSKDVRKLRDFEQTLLSNYQKFLKLLDETTEVGLKSESACPPAKKKQKRTKRSPLQVLDGNQELSASSLEGLSVVALQCLCELAVALSHFNYRSNILAVLVPQMDSSALKGEASQMCCGAVIKVFQNDLVGEVSLEAVQLITRMVKAKSYRTKPAVLRAFLHLRLHNIEEPVGVAGRGGAKAVRKEAATRSHGQHGRMSRRQRKRIKAEAKLDKEMKETEAVESREKKSKLQTEILKVIFNTYFRVIKLSRDSPLLQPVLEGLAKFAHLINVDFFSDLMSSLHSLAETGRLSNTECMQCVLTAFEILSGQGSALTIDPRQFYTQLYGAILQLDACSSNEDVLLTVKCLDGMMRKRRQVSLQRVFAFVKRLCTVSLQLFPGACLAVMATIKQFLVAYSQCEQLLDTEGTGEGVYCSSVVDPELCHASSSVLWELTLHRYHFNPTVREYATHLLAGAPSQGKNTLPSDLSRRTQGEFLEWCCVEGGLSGAVDGIAPPPPHPALKMAQKKRGARNYYYTDIGLQCEEVIAAEQHAMEKTTSLFKNS